MMKAKRSIEGKMEARKRDRERKKRNQLTENQLDRVRSTERKYQQSRRDEMTENEKRKSREIRNKKKEWKKKRDGQKTLKKIKNIEKAIRMRRCRSLLSEEEKTDARHIAKVRMASRRRNGLLRSYKQRQKLAEKNIDIWRNFFSSFNLDIFIWAYPNLKHHYKKLKALQTQVRYAESEEIKTQLYGNGFGGSWNMKMDKKEQTNEVVNKNTAAMRKHRKKIKEKIEDYDKLRQRSGQSKFIDSDCESESDGVSEHSDTDV